MTRIQEETVWLVERESGVEGLCLLDKIDALGFDSLEFVSLIMAAEDQFGVRIPQEAYPAINTVGDLAHAVESRVRE